MEKFEILNGKWINLIFVPNTSAELIFLTKSVKISSIIYLVSYQQHGTYYIDLESSGRQELLHLQYAKSEFIQYEEDLNLLKDLLYNKQV